ncbi:(2,3-dihydroxybenzoyl)adenylate synthase [Massilia sp. YMA4]|uniref:(2,3-dihydroxybenzoyl)adenylate synthase n=1 Tax=Massilia sp. YMA4 TaxID=1593482 RepID=UPI000DD107EE|nr:(2,3-dihydroxybenzoyl)adenylate synthase [Massilia sp. YMA4]AXA91155.1 (2,3-dihydroxybenzoyl)adenylate synthase [Massilia sp. YMA4]
MIEFTPWPQADAERYRAAGCWLGLPLTDILERQCIERPDAIAILCGERALTYRGLDVRAARLAQALARRGLTAGDTALVQLPNVAEFYIVYFALLKLGVAPVNALFSHQRLELTAYAQQLQPKLVIGCASHALFGTSEFADALRAQVPGLAHVLVLDAPEGGLAALIDEEGAAVAIAPSPAHQVAFFQLSGGSTGTPKLIPRTHDDYYYSVRRSAEICRLDPATRFLCALPAGHNFLLSSPGALGVFYAGGTVVLAPSPEPLGCFALIERHAVTMAALVPSAVVLWLQAAADPARRAQLASLRLLQVGGASFAEALARRVPQELGCALQQVFGMAEGLVNYTRLDDPDDRVYTTQGRPMSEFDEVRVVDADGVPVPAGVEGLLTTRGPYTFRGYYRAPEHNARVIDADGFYATGDLVRRSADGYLTVVGRVKDQINRGGEKIAAEEVENLLLRHPGVLHAALISVPHPLLGEMSCACIVPRAAGAELRAPLLRKYLREQGVAEFKLPDRFRMLDKLPLTAVGKTDKVRLRAETNIQ